MITNLKNRAIPIQTSAPAYLTRQQLADKCRTDVDRLERLMAKGRLQADATEGKDAPLFAADRLDEIKKLLSENE